MPQDNDCQQLKQQFNSLTPFSVVGRKLLGVEDFAGIKRIFSERAGFETTYKEKVVDLLRRWVDNDHFINRVEFERSGRVVIAGDLNLENLEGLSYFPSLIRKIGGSLLINDPDFEHLDFLEEVEGSLILKNAEKIKTLDRLTRAGRGLSIGKSSIEILPELVEVGGVLIAEGLTTLKSLPKLKRAWALLLNDSGIEAMPELETADSLEIEGTKITALPKLKTVFNYLKATGLITLTNLSSLQRVGNDLYINKTGLEVLPELTSVGNILHAGGSVKLTAFPSLYYVGNTLNLFKTAVKKLEKLKEVGGSFLATGVESLTSVPNLSTVGNKMCIQGTRIDWLPSLTSIGGCLEMGMRGERGFRKMFPLLEKVGEDAEGVSVYTGLYDVVEDVLRLSKEKNYSFDRILLAGGVRFQ